MSKTLRIIGILMFAATFVFFIPNSSITMKELDTDSLEPRTNDDKAIVVSNLNKFSVWEMSNEYIINWLTTGNISAVYIQIYKDNREEGFVTMMTPNDGSYNWHIPSYVEEDNSYRIKIFESINSTIYDYSESFHIVNSSTTPHISIFSPTSESIWIRGHDYEIRWNCSQDPGQYDVVNIRLYKRNNMIMSIAEQKHNTNEYLFTIPIDLELENEYRIYLQLTDKSDMVYEFSKYFSISTDSIADDPIQINFIPGYNIILLIGIFAIMFYVGFRKFRRI